MPNSTLLSTNGTATVYLVVAAQNFTQSLSIHFTVFAEAEDDSDINNYIELDVFTTTIPPSNITKNVRY